MFIDILKRLNYDDEWQVIKCCHLNWFITEIDLFVRPNLLTLSWRRPLSYRKHSIDLLCKSLDWFLSDNGLRHDRVKHFQIDDPVQGCHEKAILIQIRFFGWGKCCMSYCIKKGHRILRKHFWRMCHLQTPNYFRVLRLRYK